ncbi:S41 family peptidase [Candidatus Parcubacteria bacterium]|nr:S41 family peptidase [Candidatus Parcubacteria bacterium]
MDFAKKHARLVAGLIILVSVSFFLGARYGKEQALNSAALANLTNTATIPSANVNFAPFWKAWTILKKDYVPTSTSTNVVTDQDKVWGAIQGLTASLGDPYTVFFPPVESKEFATDIKGSFVGVGMEVGQDTGVLTIVAPLKGSPAEAAGLRAGDKILRIDDKDSARLSTEEAVRLIRGEEGTAVTFTIGRQGKTAPFTVKVVRQTINIPTIDTKDMGNGVFYIALYSFSENSPELFRGALRQFVESKDTKLILDLRGNPGGYLEAALDMASWFLPSGQVVVSEDYGPGKDPTVYRSKGYNVFNDQLKFAILVDGGSASASEILAGALSELGRATLIGQKTFGKGSVQELVPVTDDTTLKVTIARWLTPKGNSISHQGITPAIVVARTEADAKAGKDPQLDRAVQFLNTGK